MIVLRAKDFNYACVIYTFKFLYGIFY